MPSRLSSLAVALLTSLCVAKAFATPVDPMHGIAAGENLTVQRAAVEAMALSDLALPPPPFVIAPSESRESRDSSVAIAAAIPEPGIAALMALGFAGIGWITRRRQRDNAASPVPLDESVERATGDGAMKNAALRSATGRPN